MRRLLLCAALAAAACGQTSRTALPEDLSGRWRAQQIAGASLGEGVEIWIEIDARTGQVSGHTGCNPFAASMTSFGGVLALDPVREAAGECPSQAAATDEARFLAVLPAAQRYIRRGRSLELLEAAQGSETLLRFRLEDAAGG